ncbi:MAG: HigA family addiction module antidote protein [Actinomycetales bacterium]|nr:HigA family addiction module antidote protein [Actinomycetales bacterium]
MARGEKRRASVTPGELLWHEFMEPIGLTKYRVAKEIGVPPQRIGAIINGKRSITADTCLRLCRYFGLSEGYFLRAQIAHDLQEARLDIMDELDRIVPLPAPPVLTHDDESDD